MRVWWIVLIFSFCSLALNGQSVKNEREEKVKTDEVPEESLDWLSKAFPELKKVKWYYEETSGRKSFEAKFKLAGSKYSVEFSELGVIEDVEIDKRLADLSPSVREKLETAFAQFEKFKAIKIQEQWTGSSPDLLQAAVLSANTSQIELRYEVVFKALIGKQHTLWEGLFDLEGKLLSKRRIALRPTDNLDY